MQAIVISKLRLRHLHSRRRYLHYSIPACIGALLLSFFLYGNSCFAASPTASLTIATPNMTSDAIAPGSTATTSTNVTVDVKDADSYKLYISFSNTNLTGGSTTIQAGNAVANNTWGYKWDNASSYTTPSTSDVELTVPALVNNATSFTKTLSFAAKFSSDAVSGTYHASGNLKLVATPRLITEQTFTVTYDYNKPYVGTNPDPTSCTTTSSSCSVVLPSYSLSSTCISYVPYRFLGWGLNSTDTEASYEGGSTMTLTESVTLYGVWERLKGDCGSW